MVKKRSRSKQQALCTTSSSSLTVETRHRVNSIPELVLLVGIGIEIWYNKFKSKNNLCHFNNLGIQKYFFQDNHTPINSQSASIYIQISIGQSTLLIFVHIITTAMPRWKRRCLIHAGYPPPPPSLILVAYWLVNYIHILVIHTVITHDLKCSWISNLTPQVFFIRSRDANLGLYVCGMQTPMDYCKIHRWEEQWP